MSRDVAELLEWDCHLHPAGKSPSSSDTYVCYTLHSSILMMSIFTSPARPHERTCLGTFFLLLLVLDFFLHLNQKFQWEGLYGKGVLHSQTWRENRALKIDWILKGFHLLAEGEVCPVASQKLESSDDPEISGRQKFNNRISSNTHREMTSSVLYRVFPLNRWNAVQFLRCVFILLFSIYLS